MAKGERKHSPRRIKATEKQAHAVEMAKMGATYQEIADEVGYAGPSGAFKAVETALAKTLGAPVEAYRLVEIARLDAMLMGLWTKAVAGHLGAVDRVIKIMERRARFQGLDAPQSLKVEAAGVEFGTSPSVAEMAQFAGEPEKFLEHYYKWLQSKYPGRIPDALDPGARPN